MEPSSSQRSSGPRLRDVLRDDLHQGDYLSTLRRDLKDIEAYYLSDAQKERLAALGKRHRVKRWIWTAWWVLKEMVVRLSPVRRLLVVAAVVLIFLSESDSSGGGADGRVILALLILLFVIILEVKDKLLMRDELEAGRKVQRALMPEATPAVYGWDVWLSSRPANEVGGDLVDILRISQDRVAVSIADIAGKGLQAALLMVKLQASIRALASEDTSISDLVAHINEIFRRDSPVSMFASLLTLEVRPGSGGLRFVNAGHLPPYHLKESGIDELAKGEPALGLAKGTHYTEHVLELQPGEVFVAISDGVVEARRENGEFYGAERFRQLLTSLRRLSAQQMAQEIIGEIDRFVGSTASGDDLSLVILKRVES